MFERKMEEVRGGWRSHRTLEKNKKVGRIVGLKHLRLKCGL
jgi:hypothetical protein